MNDVIVAQHTVQLAGFLQCRCHYRRYRRYSSKGTLPRWCCRQPPASASRVFNVGFAGVLSEFNDQNFHRYSSSEAFRHFLLNGQQHDTCRGRKGTTTASSKPSPVWWEGLALVWRNNRRGNRSGRQVAAGVGCGVEQGLALVCPLSGRGFCLSSESGVCRRATHSASAFSRTNRQTFSSACHLNRTEIISKL